MANFDNIIQEINTNIPDNNEQLITAEKIRDTLIDFVNEVNYNENNLETTIEEKDDKIQIETSLPSSGGILPNVLYNLGTIPNDAKISITLATPTDRNIANIYTMTFDTENWDESSNSVSRGPSIGWGFPLMTRWANGESPAIEPNTYYEVSIMGNLACFFTAKKYGDIIIKP